MWPSNEAQEGETGGRLFILPYVANIPVKFPLMVARVIVQPPVPGIVFLLVRKAAFNIAFCLELQYYMTSFPLAVSSMEGGFGEPANTFLEGIVQGYLEGTIAAGGGTSVSTQQNYLQKSVTSPCSASVSLPGLEMAWPC